MSFYKKKKKIQIQNVIEKNCRMFLMKMTFQFKVHSPNTKLTTSTQQPWQYSIEIIRQTDLVSSANKFRTKC